MQPPVELLDFLKREDRYLIATHRNPDGDAIGSAVALALILEALGKQVAVFDQDPVPEQYRFLPESARLFTPESLADAGIALEDCGNLLLVDCNDLSRVTNRKDLSARFGYRNALVIDHHGTLSSFGTLQWIEPDAAATGLMILSIADALGVALTPAMASNLYAAIAVDTGNFRFENTSPEVLYAAGRLAEAGANPTIISRALFESWSSGRLALFGKFLNTFELMGPVAVAVVTQEMFAETGAGPEDTETFVEFLKILRAADVALLIREIEPGDYKLSLRAKGKVDVAAIAALYGGGGHKNAAGCEVKGTIDSIKQAIIAQVELLRSKK
jgi:phosphoesterase RecJ-like protein